MKRCPYCGEEIQDESIICIHCGCDQPFVRTAIEAEAPEIKRRSALHYIILFTAILFPIITTIGIAVRAITHTLTPTSTPLPPTVIPGGFTLVEETDLGVTFAIPISMERASVSESRSESNGEVGERYVDFYNITPPMYISISTLGEQVPRSVLESELKDSPNLIAEQEGWQEYKILQEYNDLDVAGQPAYGIAYRFINIRGGGIFRIIVTVTAPSEMVYCFMWDAPEENQEELQALFEKMLPTIRFVDN